MRIFYINSILLIVIVCMDTSACIFQITSGLKGPGNIGYIEIKGPPGDPVKLFCVNILLYNRFYGS